MNTNGASLPTHGRRVAKTVVAVGLAALIVVGVAAAAVMRGGAHGAAGASDTFVLANAVKIDTLDPAQNSVNESIWLNQNIYSRLLQPNATATKLLPDLATSWKVSNGGKTYTFKLRSAKFSDGSPVTAADAAYSILRAKNLKGGWGFLLDSVTSVKASDAHTLVIKMSRPHAPLLADLAMYAYSIVPEKLVKAQGDKFFDKPVSSGPFMVTSLNKDTELDLAANPNWYGKKPTIKNVKVQIVTNDNTRVLLLQSKKVDAIENPPGNLINQIAKFPGLQSDLFPSTRVDFIQLDQHYAPLKDQNVRLALNYGIDRNAIVKLAYSGHATPGSSFMPYKMLYWNSALKPPAYDLAKAKSYLAKSKYPNGFKIFLIEVANDVAGNSTAVVLKSQLAKLNINVDIQTYELLTAYQKEDGGKSQMGQRYWTNDIIDPDEVTTFGVDPQGGANAFSSYWSDPTATKLVHQARAELNPVKRGAMYKQIQKIVYQQVPYLILDYSPYRYAQGTWVHGFHVNPLGAYNLSLLDMTVDSH
ncbi:MAG TPA: ABC transporter substrate-binding protein [Gaiellaceae bacterium]|nr:ABC transporter substrate-binding protein [Gaiellaceae bacterium]